MCNIEKLGIGPGNELRLVSTRMSFDRGGWGPWRLVDTAVLHMLLLDCQLVKKGDKNHLMSRKHNDHQY